VARPSRPFVTAPEATPEIVTGNERLIISLLQDTFSTISYRSRTKTESGLLLAVMAFVLKQTVRRKGYAELSRAQIADCGVTEDRACDALYRLLDKGILAKVGRGCAALPVVLRGGKLLEVQGSFWSELDIVNLPLETDAFKDIPRETLVSARGNARKYTPSHSEVHPDTLISAPYELHEGINTRKRSNCEKT